MSRVALRSGIIFTKFELRKYPFVTYSVFAADTLCHAVTLTFDPLTLKVCGLYHVIKVGAKFVRNWTIPG